MDDPVRAFEALYDDHANAVFRHLFLRLGDRERAKELTQEVFMRTWQYLRTGETLAYPKAFLFRIAHNLFVNEIRTDKRTASLDMLTDNSDFDTADAHANVLEDATGYELWRQLARLSEDDRSVLIMRFVDGLQVKEIAELLEAGETTISMRIARARDKLRKLYEGPNDQTQAP